MQKIVNFLLLALRPFFSKIERLVNSLILFEAFLKLVDFLYKMLYFSRDKGISFVYI